MSGKDELIVSQALEIEELRKWKETNIEMKEKVHGIIYCIGGPLNDNILMFSHKQLGVFAEIVDALDLQLFIVAGG